MVNGSQRALLTENDCYDHLRDAIANGVLQPNQRLIEMDLAHSLGVGRATIRTALARLEQEGIVERERHRGARVRLITEAEAVETLEARTALECLAVRHAALKATDADVAELREMLDEMRIAREHADLLRVSAINGRLHRRLLDIAAHAIVSRLLEMLRPHHVRFQFRTILAAGRPERSFQEHCAIVEAVAAHDPDAAEAAMRCHLCHVTEALRQTCPDRTLSP